MSLEEMCAVWDTNAFGVLAVYQAMLPLLRRAPAGRIVNVSSRAGSLTMNSDPTNPHRAVFGPVYSASKTALTLPGFTKTNLNEYAGMETVEEGAREAVRVALLGPDGPTGTFTRAKLGTLPW